MEEKLLDEKLTMVMNMVLTTITKGIGKKIYWILFHNTLTIELENLIGMVRLYIDVLMGKK